MKVVEIINEINKLSIVDKERLLSHFKYLLMPLHDTRPVFQEVSEKKAKNGLCCVHCNASKVVRFGKFEVKNGLKTMKRQRYRCKDCQKTFTESTATPIYRTRKSNRWLEFIECVLNGLSLRESAKKMKGISQTTLFFWRHKILSDYLAYFNFLDTLAFETDERSIRTLAVESCSYPIKETNATIPLSKMIV